MAMKHFKPYTPSRRNMTVSDFSEVTKKTPEKSLLAKKRKNAGRNSYGRITVPVVNFSLAASYIASNSSSDLSAKELF